MTAAEFAKWIIVASMAVGTFANLAVALCRGTQQGDYAAGVLVGALIRVAMIIGICVWWQPC